MIPTWLHPGSVLFGVLIGATAVSVFWLWLVERRDRVLRARDHLHWAQVREQDAAIRELYQQTSRLAHLAIHHHATESHPRAIAWTSPRES